MSATATATAPRSDVMTARLQNLRAERDEILAELIVSNSGDTADRATNVDANARLTLVEQRIATVENQIHNAGQSPRAKTRTEVSGVTVGDIVTVDFGDGPETYLFADLDQADGEHDVISPAGPLGRAIVGAAVDTTVTYRAHTKRALTAKIVAVN
jgi:transcription elongation factor GreA